MVFAALRKLVDEEYFQNHEFFRFTIKTLEQGEMTERGLVNEVNYSVLAWGKSVQNIVETVAKQNIEYKSGLTNMELIDLATNYMKDNPCLVIIDNAEDVEDPRKRNDLEFETFEKFIQKVGQLDLDTKSRVIITSRLSDDYPGVNTVEAEYLNHEEMIELAIKRSELHYNEKERYARLLHLEKGLEKQWEDVRKWTESKLGGKQKRAMGHPHFIIIAVYGWSIASGEKRTQSFFDLLKEWISEGKFDDIEKYITSKSITFIKPEYEEASRRLAYYHPNEFSRKDVERLFKLKGSDTFGLEDGLIQHLDVELGLIRDMGFAPVGQNPERWEWVDYGRKELADDFEENYLKTRQDKKKEAAKQKEQLHEVDKAIEALGKIKQIEIDSESSHSIKQAEDVIDDIVKNIDLLIQRSSEGAGVLYPSKVGDRIKARAVKASRDAETAARWVKAKDPKNKIRNADKLNKAASEMSSLSVSGLKQKIGKMIQDESDEFGDDEQNRHDIEVLCTGYLIHLTRNRWISDHNGDSLDQHIDFIIENSDKWFSKIGFITYLEDIVRIRFEMDGNHEKMMQLAMQIESRLHPKTAEKIMASIADGHVVRISDSLRGFISKYIKKHVKNRFVNLRYSRGIPRKNLVAVLDILSEDWVGDEGQLIDVKDVSTLTSLHENYCKKFLLETPPLKGAKNWAIYEPRGKINTKILIYSAPVAFVKNGTMGFQALELQHMFTIKASKEDVMHVRYLDTNHEMTKQLKSKSVDSPASPIKIQSNRKEQLKRSYRKYIIQLFDLADAWLFNDFCLRMNEFCVRNLKMTSNKVRSEIWPGGKKAKEAIEILFPNQVKITEEGINRKQIVARKVVRNLK